jgi:hypothetical protein
VTTQPPLLPFLPDLMMRRAELTKARRWLGRLEGLRSQLVLDARIAASGRERDIRERKEKERTAIEADMSSLAFAVWEREVGLERYSVVHVRREDMAVRIQLLDISFHESWRWSHLLWSFGGRRLRKNGTLGSESGGMSFGFARIERRLLDGSWQELSCWGEA